MKRACDGLRSVMASISIFAFAAGCGSGGDSSTTPDKSPDPVVAATRDIGALAAPPTVLGRDGGAAAVIGGQIVWAFGDTFISTLASDGSYYRTNTASRAPLGLPLAGVDQLDGKGVPLPMIAFTAAEKAYNDSTGKADDRIAIWPSFIASNPDGTGTVFFIDLYVRPNFNLQGIGIGTARLVAGSTVAVRNPGFLFSSSEPSFEDGGVVDGYVYLYGNLKSAGQSAFAIARATVASAATRSAYTFWDGAAWNTDVKKAVSVATIPFSPTLSYNAYLGRYIIVFSAPFSSDVMLQTASAPQGPWSKSIKIATGLSATTGEFDYVAREHPELSSNGGRTIVISYARPLGNFRGEVRLMAVDFN